MKNTVKRLLQCLLVVLIFLSLINSYTVQAATKVIELRLAVYTPAGANWSKAFLAWADKLKQQSGERVNVTTYFSETLLNQSEILRGTAAGIADISAYFVGIDAGLQPLNWMVRLPFMGWPGMEKSVPIYQQLWNKFPELRNEFKNFKVFPSNFQAPYQMHFCKKVVRVPEDIKGLRLIARAEWADVLKNSGASAVTIGAGDMYMSLERGLVEGQLLHFPAAYAFKTLELLHNHTIFGDEGCSTTLNLLLMNLNSWNSLPPDIQKMMEDLSSWLGAEQARLDAVEIEKAVNAAKAMNHTFTYLSPTEIQLWQDIAKPVHDKWIAETEAKGKPAKAVYEEAKRLIRQSQ